MDSVAFIFPGQASQYVGMGKSLFRSFPEAREVFEEADQVLGFSLSKLCFDGPESDLSLTTNTQPAILTVSIAAYRVLVARGWKPSFVAGHSLGEYSALVAAGSLSFADAVALVRKRGQYMQEAVPPGVGAMVAVRGLSIKDIKAMCQEASLGHVCSLANLNSPDQIVVSGNAEAVSRAVSLFKMRRARTIVLPVSAPFHCELMRPAADKLAMDLRNIDFQDPVIPVVTNVTARIVQTGAEVRKYLIAQVCMPVLWADSIEFLANNKVTTFIEVGPKTVLSGLVNQINRNLIISNVESFDTLRLAESIMQNAR